MAGDRDAARRLLELPGTDPNDRNDDNLWSVLMVAAADDAAEIVAALLARPELEVDARDDRGQSALHIAAGRGHDRTVGLLVADPRSDPNGRDDLRQTPLLLAAAADHRATVECLLRDARTEVNLVDRDRQTALHWAALAGHDEVVALLLDDDRTNPGITNRPDGRTAAELAQLAGHPAIAEMIRHRGGGSDELSPGDTFEPRVPAPPQRPGPRIRRPGGPRL